MRPNILKLTLSVLGIIFLLASPLYLSTGQALNVAIMAELTSRVSVASDGEQSNNNSFDPSISADGRFVAFESTADNLVEGDTKGVRDIFVRDRQAEVTERVSVSSGGEEGNSWSDNPSISADGRFVAFHSSASNLVEGDTNEMPDVFVHDRQSGITERVSVSSSGEQGSGSSTDPSISADGRFVAFHSNSVDLVSEDTNGVGDVFVRDRQAGITERVSVSSSGVQGNGLSEYPAISADGRYVAFHSNASSLVSGDTNAKNDVFLRDRQSGVTERISLSSSGDQGNNDSGQPSISADGRFVAFFSYASNLVSGDTEYSGDVFIKDRQSGVTELVSVSTSGQKGNGFSGWPSISLDGSTVAFISFASNFFPGDTGAYPDIFIHDRQSGSTELGSLSSSGEQGDHGSDLPSVSGDGCIVAFDSQASNLVSGDTNGRQDIFTRNRCPEWPGEEIVMFLPVIWR